MKIEKALFVGIVLTIILMIVVGIAGAFKASDNVCSGKVSPLKISVHNINSQADLAAGFSTLQVLPAPLMLAV